MPAQKHARGAWRNIGRWITRSWLERVEAAEMLIQQLVAERDESRDQLCKAAARNQKLQEELAVTQEQFRQQRETTVKTTRKITGADGSGGDTHNTASGRTR